MKKVVKTDVEWRNSLTKKEFDICREGGTEAPFSGKLLHNHQTGDYQSDLVTNTQHFTKIIESYIRRYPEQWIWMHDRWKTQPKIS